MSRIITLFLAVLMTPAVVLCSEAKAQQANFRQAQDADRNLLAIDAAPVIAGAQAPVQNAPQPGQQGYDILGVQKFAGNAKAIVSYLMGANAVSPQTIQQGAQSVDPHGSLPPGNQNLMSLDAAVQKGDTKGAIALLQANRVAFNPQQAFAYKALAGIPGKGPDINAAIDAANQAAQHVLDGSNVKFAHGDLGQITATVTMAGTGQPPKVISLTVAQFQQYLNPKGDGQWDKLMNSTVPATLEAVSQRDAATASAVELLMGARGARRHRAAIKPVRLRPVRLRPVRLRPGRRVATSSKGMLTLMATRLARATSP